MTCNVVCSRHPPCSDCRNTLFQMSCSGSSAKKAFYYTSVYIHNIMKTDMRDWIGHLRIKLMTWYENNE